MLLSLGLTADAAAAHRHEYSSGRPQSYTSVLPASPVTTPPRRASSDQLQRPPLGKSTSVAFDLPPTPSSMARAEETDSVSESEESRTASIDGPTPLTSSQVGIVTRSRTSYHLAHPPPSFINRQRLHIRPKLLLQLQQLSVASRPAPALDVLPSTILPPRLARKFPRFFRSCEGLGPNDLVIVSSEEYGASDSKDQDGVSSFDADISECRRVVATICPRRKDDGGLQGKADICLSDGPLWEASPMPNGGYEFTAVDEHGLKLTARWVPRVSPGRRRSSGYSPRAPANSSKTTKKFTFSIIRPNSRRHPVIAYMTRSSIDVLDSYPTSPPGTLTHNSPLATPRTPSSPSASEYPFFSPQAEQTFQQTDETLRTLILVSGVWVAFREGWSQSFRYSDAVTSSVPETAAASSSSALGRRSASSPAVTAARSPFLGAAISPAKKSFDGQEHHKKHSFLHRSGTTAASSNGASAVPRRAHSTTSTALRQGGARSGAVGSVSTTTAVSPRQQLPSARANSDPDHRYRRAGEPPSGLSTPSSTQAIKHPPQGQLDGNGSQGGPKTQHRPVVKRGWTKLRAIAALIKTSVGTH
jgi:hypothetical protein